MTAETTYTAARANFASLCDKVTNDREVVIIHRRGADDVALIAAEELQGLIEAAYLLRSPQNAERLLRALNRARKGATIPSSIQQLAKQVGLEE